MGLFGTVSCGISSSSSRITGCSRRREPRGDSGWDPASRPGFRLFVRHYRVAAGPLSTRGRSGVYLESELRYAAAT
ncbi:MAG: hypothetical protein OZSIB_1725 [Candidatus Ozemobacter sibiricus]|uniref:Uncharacterized protein n=1 Tax=Candidatus Ozemobacter sibiricus TaxID=2268124 RepID=A0A367ZKD3_9BACT|nr:MAG: hypothetical protein OZSIB_1725 [Candidatus Ozemobacter sibiricus]